MKSPHEKNICIGKIAGAHGVRGLVKIFPYCNDPDLLEKVDAYRIRLLHSQGKFLLAEIDGIQDRDAAQALKGTELWIDRAALPEPEVDEFYFEDLKGLEVKNLNGTAEGKVIAVQDFGSVPLLEIKPSAGSTYYLPFTKENVPEINISEGFVTINPPEGLVD